ncbi:hypothetical protein CI807_15255 [Pseudomonas sp. NS1(2017)]|uniref:membrane-targeted effector domain-containing toxin n=1 Tax=Pseudomonas sp. NS1(2017) TaxID=2025658 RepID=UPI000BA29C15|nr:membrane-targeted effector domain-containing toxin [Pseudomonas sp. NS1(2017)]ASV37483.1 hypothetical protein CI807_15255 [Pseudomonas sp. NS1(2017)]
MSTATSSLSPYPLIDDRELVGVLPVHSRAWHLKQLQAESLFGERLVQHQPSLERVSREVFQQSLDRVFAGLPINPDAICLEETLPPGAARRSMTQVVRDCLASGTVPTESQITGFSTVPDAAGIQRRVEIDPKTFVEVLNQHLLGLFEHFSQRLSRFWRNPVRQGNELSMRDTWLGHRHSELVAEAALRRADDLATPGTGLSAEGVALVKDLVETPFRSVTQTPKVALYRLVIKGGSQDIHLAAAFMLASWGGLSKRLPVLLYTPQRGLQEFASDSALLNALRLQQVQAGDRDELLVNVAVPDIEQALALRKEGRAGWDLDEMLPDAQGSLLGRVLDEQLAQQQVNVGAAFLPFRPGIEARLSQALRLPSGLPGDLLSRPLRPDTLPVVPSADIAITDQQQNLIGQLDKLNSLTGKLLVGSPGFDGFFQAQLKVMFPSFTGLISPLAIHFTRSRFDEQGKRQPAESKTLESLLGELLEESEEGGHQDGAFYVEPDTLDESYKLQQVGTLGGLVAAMKQAFPILLRAFWATFQVGQGARAELLIRLRKQMLATEAALRTVDGTLTSASRTLIDNVLKYPTPAARELAFPVAQRPQVYSVTLTGGERFVTALIVSPDSVSPPTGPLVLWTAAQGFEEFSSLGALNAELALRLDDGAEDGRIMAQGLFSAGRDALVGQWLGRLELAPVAIADDFVADGVQALLAKQQQDVRLALSDKDSLRPGAVDKVLDLAPQLDVAAAFVARNQRLEELMLPAWYKALSRQDRQALEVLELDAQEKTQAVSALIGHVPSLPEYARQQLRGKLRGFLERRGLPAAAAQRIDPDKVIVTRVEVVRVNSGQSAGIARPIERSTVDRMSLTQLTLKNLDPWEWSLSSTSRVSISARVTYADGRQVVTTSGEALELSRETIEQWVTDINAGHNYCEDILKTKFVPSVRSAPADQLVQAWIAAQAATLKYAAQSARLNPSAYSTALAGDPAKKRAEQWVAAVLASAMPGGRPRVEGREVHASLLRLGAPDVKPEKGGRQWVQGLVLISTDQDAELVLYAPDAPDGLELRELRSEVELIALLGREAWRSYLMDRLSVRSMAVMTNLLLPGFEYMRFSEVVQYFVAGSPETEERLPPLIVQRMRCRGDLLHGMYYLQVLRLLELAQRGSVTNAQVSFQSTFNKVMFGIEVVGTLLDMLPWVGFWITSNIRLWGRLARTAVRTFRTRGQSIPGMIVREGHGRRWLSMQFATASAPSVGIRPLAVHPVFFRSSAASAQPFLQVPRMPEPVSVIPSAWKTSAVRVDEATLLLRGLEPNSRGVYRTATGEYLIRTVDARGRALVFRIKSDFRLYEGGGATVQVIDARSRNEVGFLQAGEQGQWQPAGASGGGVGESSPAIDLPAEEYLLTQSFLDNDHGARLLRQDRLDYFNAWFARDWRQFYRTVQTPPRPLPLVLPASATVDDLIRVWPDAVDGMVLGEAHDEIASVTFLTDHMQALYARGFRTLYIEGMHATGQPVVHFAPGSQGVMASVSRKARSCGMSVRGLDDNRLTLHRDVYTSRPRIDALVRIEEMNYFAARQIQAHHPTDGGKWIAWVGKAHMNTSGSTPGLAELMGGVSVDIGNAKAGQPTVVRVPARGGFLSRGPQPDVQIELDVSANPTRLPTAPAGYIDWV